MSCKLKILTWNINSIRARAYQLNQLISDTQPDIILLQEIKCESHNFPFQEINESHKYNFSINGQKSYNGVAILSKFPLEDIKFSFLGNPCPDQARFIEANCLTEVGYVKVISIYVPNGGEVNSDKFQIKLLFIDKFIKYLHSSKNLGESIILGGDFNVAPYDTDVYSAIELQNTTCFTLPEKQYIRKLINHNFIDIYRLFHQRQKKFTWWDYRAGAFERNLGMRIDYILCTISIALKATDCYIDYHTRNNHRASDHAPVIASFE